MTCIASRWKNLVFYITVSSVVFNKLVELDALFQWHKCHLRRKTTASDCLRTQSQKKLVTEPRKNIWPLVMWLSVYKQKDTQSNSNASKTKERSIEFSFLLFCFVWILHFKLTLSYSAERLSLCNTYSVVSIYTY